MPHDRPTVRIRVNRVGGGILRSLIKGQIDQALMARRRLIDAGDGPGVEIHEEYLSQLRLLGREVTRISAEMGWLPDGPRDEG